METIYIVVDFDGDPVASYVNEEDALDHAKDIGGDIKPMPLEEHYNP